MQTPVLIKLMNFASGPAVAACLVLSSPPALAQPSPRELLDKAREFATAVPAYRRVDTTEQATAALIDQKRLEQQPLTNVVTIEVDTASALARQTAMVQGKELVLLKKGRKAAMKLGAGPWEAPSGPYQKIAADMGNLFVCEIETPESKKNEPKWVLAETERMDGQEVYVIESQGDSAVALAQERMMKGIAKSFSGDPTQKPAVTVLQYSAMHWLSKSDFRRLQSVQTSKIQMTISLPNGRRQLVEQSSKTTSKYHYESVTIDIPADAQKLLVP